MAAIVGCCVDKIRLPNLPSWTTFIFGHRNHRNRASGKVLSKGSLHGLSDQEGDDTFHVMYLFSLHLLAKVHLLVHLQIQSYFLQ